MKKYLMRAPMSVLESKDLYTVVTKNSFADNAGNMLFPYSICRNIMDEETQITFYSKFKESDAEWINSEFDAFLIPLANAFRINFEGTLKKMTALIKQIRIPVIVIGIGLQTFYEPEIDKVRPYDATALEFCNEVLERSDSIGVRGQFTADYLTKHLGLSPSKIDVIGCPSMYLWGDTLPLRDAKALNRDSKISICYNSNDERLMTFIDKCKADYPNHYMAAQVIEELRLLYAGISVTNEKHHPKSPINVKSEDFIDDKVKMFINVPSWLKHTAEMDLCVGSRIHRSIAGVLSGTPTMIIPQDSRTRELSDYHNIPHYNLEEVEAAGYSLEKLYDQTDFSMIQKGHAERFDHYCSFMKRNGIEVIGREANDHFDSIISNTEFDMMDGVRAYTHYDKKIRVEQLRKYKTYLEEQMNKKSIKPARLKELERQMDCVKKNLSSEKKLFGGLLWGRR